MERELEVSIRHKIKEINLGCKQEIQNRQHKLDSASLFFRQSRELVKAKSAESLQNQENIQKAKLQLRALEDDLVKSLAAKTSKEAKWMEITDSISTTKSRIQGLKRIVEDLKAKKNEYAAVVSEQTEALAAYDEKCEKDMECYQEMGDAISWYNRMLGFRIECGRGVKFIFTNISINDSKEEYSFTIRYKDNSYTLLDCDPHLDDTEELIHEVNKNNCLFKFVRIMRQKFQKASAFAGTVPQVTSLYQETPSVSMSAPVSSVSTDDISMSSTKQEEHSRKTKRISMNVHHNGILSPEFASSVRKSQRLKVTTPGKMGAKYLI